MLQRLASALVLTAGMAAFAHAQVLPFRTYTTRDGLPSNNIRALHQDDQNRLWVGTDNGIAVYDGQTWKILSMVQGLPSNIINGFPTSEPSPPPPGDEAVSEGPAVFALDQNPPNPFNPVTTITFAVPGKASVGTRHAVSLQVFDMLGRRVATLVDDMRAPGVHSVQFNASNLASGTYIYRLTAGGFTATRRMMLVK